MKKETMTSRERVKNVIEHRKVDRMPIDLGGHYSTGISAYAYQNLREYLGLEINNIEMFDCTQCLARVDADIIERFHIDTILLNPKWPQMYKWNPREKFVFNVPSTFKPIRSQDGGYSLTYKEDTLYMPAGGYFFDGAFPDYYEMEEKEKIDFFGKRAEQLYKETDKFTMMMGFAAYFYGIDFACDMLTDPEECKQLNEEVLEKQITYFDKVNKRFGRYIGAIEVNGDMGMQSAPMCSPESYEEVSYPYLKRFCEHVHQTSEIKIFMHSCGCISPLIPYIIGAGVDALNPVQISAEHMEPVQLKQKYGDKICFWGGGCDTQNVLWKKTAQEVASHTKELVNIFKKDSGFVFTQVHNIMGNVPPENIIAMLDTAYENSFY